MSSLLRCPQVYPGPSPQVYPGPQGPLVNTRTRASFTRIARWPLTPSILQGCVAGLSRHSHVQPRPDVDR